VFRRPWVLIRRAAVAVPLVAVLFLLAGSPAHAQTSAGAAGWAAKDCETCHLPGTYDFSSTTNGSNGNASASVIQNRLYRTVGTGKYNGTASNPNPVAVFSISPYVIADNVMDYGTGFGYNAGTAVATPAAGTTLVISPITTVCFSCHDSTLARAHIESNGGSIYAPRTAALAKTETCMVCHDVGRIADIKVMHAK